MLDSAGAYLKRALDLRQDETLGGRVITFGMRLLGDLVKQVADDVASQDLAEVALVYDVLSSQLATVTGRLPDELYPALVELCDDSAARPLVARVPRPQPALVASLRALVLRIRVTYGWPKATDATRVVQVMHRAGGAKVMAITVEHSMSRDDLPAHVRGLAFTTTERSASFQLFPRSS
ncbi:hypothetical protein ACFFX1_22335 [Dactylosporangium sucinum]|uniref:hypothetical protein n=1 Tax=Dactylosporangium sucinum TaxID=1424081 RepID=UPI00167CB3BE|nr:hypothetical protein [Dactylosporangium sucinum]